MPDLQETFNTVARHLLKQGKRAEELGICQYRAPNGCMCAVGVLIPDSKYTMEMEGLPVEKLAETPRFGLSEILGSGRHLAFVGELQSIHDNEWPTRWAIHLRDIAKRYQLAMPEPL